MNPSIQPPSDPSDPFLDALEREAGRVLVVMTPEALDTAAQDLDARIARAEQWVDQSGQAAGKARTALSSRQTLTLPNPFGSFRAAFVGLSVVVLAVLGVVLYGRDGASHITQRYSTSPGQRSVVRLAHGSEMILAPQTSVSIARGVIEVSGEAYFTVQPSSSRPFLVRTRSSMIRVLGTRFNVRQYPTDRSSQVVVEDGKVSLRPMRVVPGSDAQIVLTARMMGRVSDSTIATTSGVSVSDYVGWTQGRLVFNETPLREVIDELSRAYGTELRLADTSLATRPMTLTVSVSTEPLTRILDVISLTNKAHFTRVGNAFVLTSGRGIPHTIELKQFPQPEKQYGR